MDLANDLELTRYYRDRKVWLVEPDVTPARVTKYPESGQKAGDPDSQNPAKR
jgi:hypothetical protein